MQREQEVYKNLLSPLGIPHPKLYETASDGAGVVLLMEDLGSRTVEMEPTREHLCEAARELAVIRARARQSLADGLLDRSSCLRYTKTPAMILKDLSHVERSLYGPEPRASVLLRVRDNLPGWLERLHSGSSATLVHNDYNLQNLMLSGNSVLPIDWSNAYLGTHLGDLYCLISEGSQHGVDPKEIVAAFQSVACLEEINWGLNVGGICWLIQGLRWVLEEGIEAVPSSKEWIPDMLSDIRECVERLDA